MSKTRIAFIGAGNMAASLIGGLRAKGLDASQIRASDPGAETRAKVAETAQTASPVGPERVKALEARFGEGERIAAANLKRVAEAGIPIAMGTDAGNPLTLHGPAVYAEMDAMQAAGLTPMQVLTASTRGGAAAMGREKDLGTVEKGKQADLLIVAADPTADVANFRKVRWVVRGGVVRSIEELHALATTPERPETP